MFIENVQILVVIQINVRKLKIGKTALLKHIQLFQIHFNETTKKKMLKIENGHLIVHQKKRSAMSS